MATGGEAPGPGENGEHPLGRRGRPQFHRHLSRDDIGNQARFLITRFIHDRMQRNGVADVPGADALIEPGTPSGPPIEHIREVAESLRRIGDELDGDESLQRMIGQITPDAPRQTFLTVAKEIFADGVFNWGRVVALFYFAYKMAMKAFEDSVSSNALLLVRAIIEWVVSFIIDYVAPWILERGGWEAIQEYFGTPAVQAIAVFLGGVISSALFILWRSR